MFISIMIAKQILSLGAETIINLAFRNAHY